MIPDSLELTSLSATNAVTTIGKHAVGATVIWNPDTLNSFRYQPSATFILNNKQITNTGSSYNDTIPLLSRSDGKEYDAGHDNSFSHDFFWHRKLSNEGESINISHSLTVNNEADEDQTINDLTSFTKELNSTLFDRQAVTRSNSNMIVLSVNYNYPFNKQLSAEITGITNYSSSFYSLLTYDKNPATGQYDLFSESQSNLLNRSINTESLSPLLVYQIKDRYQLSIGVVSQRQDIQDHFLTGDGSNHRYLNFLPTVVVEIPNTRINFGEQITQPGITQLQPDTIEYSQLYKVTGNPSLQPRDSHYLSCMYGKYDENSQSFLNIFESVSLSQRDVVQDYTISTNGNTALTYVNRNGGLSATSTIDYSKSFKKISSWQNSIHVDLETSFTRMAFILNGNDGIQSTSNFGLSGSADFNYNDILNLSGQYGFSKSATVYKRVQYAPVTTYVQNFIPNIDLNWPKRVSFDASCTINYNPQVPQGFKQETNILNAAISIQIQKHDRGQLKLSAYDLLNQNVSVYRTAANNAIITNEQQLLNRYFLLTYLYKFGVNR